MKLIKLAPFALIGLLFLDSCKKDDPQPVSAYDSQAKLLAGEKGQSKTWKLVSETQRKNSGTEGTVSIPTCFLDNTYVFSNNDRQDYVSNEGATKCDPADPAITESGTWSFTADGKVVFVLANNYGLTSPSSPSGLYTNFPFPSEVITLTDTAMVSRMTITVDGDVYTITFTFSRV